MATPSAPPIETITVYGKQPSGTIGLSNLQSGPRGAGPGGGPGFAGPRTARVLSKLQAGIDAAAKAGKPIEEIVVTAKKTPIRAFSVMPFGAAALFAVDIGAKIADAISQRRLDEAGRIATLTVPPKPDTPVATIVPETIPEIVVTAKRPLPRVVPAPSGFVGSGLDFSRSRPFVDFPDITPTLKTPKIKAPNVALGEKPKPKLPGGLAIVGGLIGTGSVVEPGPRSRLLNVGSGKPKLTSGFVPGTGAAALPGFAMMPQTSPSLAGGGCQPCPKPKRKKPRSVCYRKMVNERRNRSNDEVFKWEKIKCR